MRDADPTLTAALRDAAVRHLDADPRGIVVRSGPAGTTRIDSRLMGWTAEPLPHESADPYRLYEFTSDVTPFHATEARPLVAVLGDRRSFLLTAASELAAFLAEAMAGGATALPLARVVTHLQGRGMERVVVGASDLTVEGRASLRESGVEPEPPEIAPGEDGAIELRYLTAALRADKEGGSLVADLRAWTVRRLPDGTVDWQARPVALGVPPHPDATS